MIGIGNCSDGSLCILFSKRFLSIDVILETNPAIILDYASAKKEKQGIIH